MDEQESKRYWKSLDEREADYAFPQDEFREEFDVPAVQLGRRGFLKAAGFTAAVAAIAGCSRAPVQKAIPYLIQPEELVAGKSYYYATTCAACSAGCGVLVKTRDGRPVKLEGNPQHPVSRGGLCAVGQASLLGLYDSQRLTGPLAGGKPASWEEADGAILSRLAEIRAKGGAVRFLSGTVTSPALRTQLGQFLGQFKDARHVQYDALSSSAILDAQEQTHGVRALPHYDFAKAEVIVSFDADFLGTWIAPVEFAAGYRAGRVAEVMPPRFSYHAQIESRMSLTGTKADRRVLVAPGEMGLALSHLAARIARFSGAAFDGAGMAGLPAAEKALEELAGRLWSARGRSLVVSGSQDVAAQVLVNFINQQLGNYGATVELEKPSSQKLGSDRALEALLGELKSGKVAALFLLGVNPVYELPDGAALAEALKRLPLLVSLSERVEETSELAHFICPDHHFLESWSDAEANAGVVSLSQPAIHALGNTRAALESLAAWSGRPQAAYEILRGGWRERIVPRQKKAVAFDAFWDQSVHDGFAEVEARAEKSKAFRKEAVRAVSKAELPASGMFALALYPKISMGDGRHSYNPWLQELPDPVSKVAWDNYACVAPGAAARLSLSEGDVVRLEANGSAVELPVLVQPGQQEGTIAVALGYGRQGTERFVQVGPKWLFGKKTGGADGRVGKNAAPLLRFAGGQLQYAGQEVRLTRMEQKIPLACTQSHHTLSMPKSLPIVGNERREIVRETTLAALLSARNAAGEKGVPAPAAVVDLWPHDHPSPVHQWGMAIDLTACTGCSACVVACQAENNIPVVGKDEVLRHREMHWMRIDRYYAGEGAEEVSVVHQPMLCQQCANAPCETVCPVLATVHSDEGLNQQVYNRCIGTRYCANNCPYKTRRFNWFNYVREDHLANLALNPDVTVRSRGIMEKCTFCVQRIQEGKSEAKRQGAALADGNIQTACQQSCPSQAIVFGDLNDPQSRVSKAMKNSRNYRVLGEFNFRPSIGYLDVVRNRAEGGEDKGNG
jgi:molybdopterin-containing oxidoreductase family iron-sulfur binding subunit